MNPKLLIDLLSSRRIGSTIELPAGDFEFTEPVTIDDCPGIIVDARQSRFITPGGQQRWLSISHCDGMRWRGGQFLGKDTQQRVLDLCKATNAAGTEPVSTDFGYGLSISESHDFVLECPAMKGFDRCLDVHKCNHFTLDRGAFEGVYDGKLSKWENGVFQPVVKDMARSIYAVNVRNCHWFEWTGGMAKLAGGALVAGSGDDGGSSKYLRVEKLKCWDSADNGLYGSSTPYARVTDCRFYNFHNGHAAKLRGNGCAITFCEGFDGHAGYLLEGVGKTADQWGAASYGGAIHGNLIERARDAAIQIDETAQGDLYPRHVAITGNRCFSCGTMTSYKGRDIMPPIALGGGLGYLIDQNIVVDYAHDAFLYLQKPSNRTIIGASNVTSKAPHVQLGQGGKLSVPFTGLQFN